MKNAPFLLCQMNDSPGILCQLSAPALSDNIVMIACLYSTTIVAFLSHQCNHCLAQGKRI